MNAEFLYELVKQLKTPTGYKISQHQIETINNSNGSVTLRIATTDTTILMTIASSTISIYTHYCDPSPKNQDRKISIQVADIQLEDPEFIHKIQTLITNKPT